MNKVIFEMRDGTKREFDGEKFTDNHLSLFNDGTCDSNNCETCPLGQGCSSEDADVSCVDHKGFSICEVKKAYRQQNKCEECENKMPLIRNMLSCSCCADSPELKSNFKQKKKMVKKEKAETKIKAKITFEVEE